MERSAPGPSTDFLRPMGRLGQVSALGIGSYLGNATTEDDDRYEASISGALRCGVTLVDTAINYRCQHSERVVGRALHNYGGTALVCTKGGYIPLDTPAPASKAAYRAYITREYLNTGIINSDELVAGGHCIAPAFLSDQVARSRWNLGVDVIDLYYLHNPEQQLDAVPRDVFTHRLRDAFAALEQCVSDETIRAYGCATWNGLRVAPAEPNHLSLESLVATARDIAGDDHHFTAIQLPINLAMSEAVRAQTQMVKGKPCTLLEAAAELGVAVVAAAPLMQGRLAQELPAEIRDALPSASTDAERALLFVRALPGVASVVVGMRSIEHVKQNLALFR